MVDGEAAGPAGDIQIVTAAVIVREGTVLLAKRAPGGSLGGKWEFPGGKLETGEGNEEALARELREELDVEVEIGEAIATTEFRNGPKRYRLCAYRIRTLRGTPRAREHEEVRWVPFDQVEAYDLADSDRSMLPQIRRALRGA